uniref:hypothetical protein n=1 Tax=Pedobacter schmidteae TaxID=2201271 RepID=UPI000EB16609|nr:hypothetical protein [Pedobacter schmidteae]
MKISILLIVAGINIALAQSTKMNDRLTIHNTIVKALRSSGAGYTVFPNTKKKAYADFNFKERGVDTISKKPWNDKEWISFLAGVDTTQVKDYPLSKNGTPFFKPDKKSNPVNKTVVFAPIIFSKDGRKAFCTTSLHSSKSGTGSGIAWYFEAEQGEWKLKASQTYLYSD